MTWSSKQRLNLEDQTSLAKDLLALSILLERKPWNTMDTMTNMTLKDLTQITTTISTLKNILINLERE